MSISGVNGIGATAYAYMNSSMKTTGEGNFASEVQKAEERQSTTSTTSAWAGDMVISQPPNYSGFTYIVCNEKVISVIGYRENE